eukprot:CAMPEP_0196667722 /NCGR_PEP_ID=MMETSP1086-20130531/65237_1 /TAXON_ID=77921 /ORGANISM="Cyanoptyche  gloeocystis , Strain SAG4.97" /LENGTH=294 /DNA_ID=CAMNT_0042005077 /DNA_START=17 /DNA_END=901 /DNA_ORIENTATION=+
MAFLSGLVSVSPRSSRSATQATASAMSPVLPQGSPPLSSSFTKRRSEWKLSRSFLSRRAFSLKASKVVYRVETFNVLAEVQTKTKAQESVTINNTEVEGHIAVTIIGNDRPGLLEALLATFRQFGFTVAKASVMTSGTEVNDKFYVTYSNGDSASEEDPDILASLHDALLEDLTGAASERSLQRQSNNHPKVVREVDHAVDAQVRILEQDDSTSITVRCADRDFLLHDIVGLLKYMELDIHAAHIHTAASFVSDQFWVSRYGNRLPDDVKSEVTNSLLSLLANPQLMCSANDSY